MTWTRRKVASVYAGRAGPSSFPCYGRRSPTHEGLGLGRGYTLRGYTSISTPTSESPIHDPHPQPHLLIITHPLKPLTSGPGHLPRPPNLRQRWKPPPPAPQRTPPPSMVTSVIQDPGEGVTPPTLIPLCWRRTEPQGSRQQRRRPPGERHTGSLPRDDHYGQGSVEADWEESLIGHYFPYIVHKNGSLGHKFCCKLDLGDELSPSGESHHCPSIPCQQVHSGGRSHASSPWVCGPHHLWRGRCRCSGGLQCGRGRCDSPPHHPGESARSEGVGWRRQQRGVLWWRSRGRGEKLHVCGVPLRIPDPSFLA